MSASPPQRDDRQLIRGLGLIPKLLIGISVYIPISAVKKSIFRSLGATIGRNVYFGPGSMLISTDFHQVSIGDDVFISPGAMLHVHRLTIGEGTSVGYQGLLVGDSLTIGSRCNISNRAFIECSYAPVTIGDYVTIAASVIISSHDGAYRQTRDGKMKALPITINDRAFIGNHATVLPGVEIGERAIIGAGAVVTKNVEPEAVVTGIPAKDLGNTGSS